jgi:hypothetical protein
MKTKLLAAAAVVATAIAATPAAAQYPYPYPNNGYPYPNNNGAGVIGSIINSVLGYGQYPYGNYGYGNQSYMAYQTAVDQCSRAVEARLNNSAMNNSYNQWNPYNNRYGNWARQGYGRVLGIENVQLRKYNRIRVRGVATSGNVYSQPYGYGGYQYNNRYGTPDLKFKCNADQSGRVYDVDITRQSYYGRWR